MHYDIKKIKQLKLVSGEEIICEIIEETEEDLIVRAPLTIQFHQNPDATRLWTFRLFMCYQDDPDRFVLIKVDKIMGIGNPIHELVKQYLGGVDQMYVFDHDDPMQPVAKAPDPFEEWERNIREGMEESNDSDGGSNVIPFPTVH